MARTAARLISWVPIATVVWWLGGAVGCRELRAEAPPRGYVLDAAHSDEFKGNALDTGKWNSEPSPWGAWTWDASHAKVEGNILRLSMSYAPHTRGDQQLFYKSGVVVSRAAPIREGFFQARIKAAPLFPGVCPAFWAFRNDREAAHGALGWSEIDFVELTQNTKSRNACLMDFTGFLWRMGPVVSPAIAEPHFQKQFLVDGGFDPREGWHVYSCLWDASGIRWSVDGKRLAELPDTRFVQPLDVVLSLGLRKPLIETPSPVGFPTTMEVDWVRVWTKRVK